MPRGKRLNRIISAPVPKPWERKPMWFAGSTPEWAIYWAFLKLGYIEGVTFFYQSPFAGGRMFAGGGVLDFWVPDIMIGIRVQGTYFHYGKGADTIAYDRLQKIQLEQLGNTVIDIDEEPAMENPIGILRDALQGVDKSRGRK